MDKSGYHQAKTQRGFTYSYYFSPPVAGKPVIFFSHGFPTSSYLWRRQVAFFEALGYGLLVPDHLGYGGTDKPTDPKFYFGSGIAQDVVDMLDVEGIQHVIAVGHDWGSRVVSRILNYHPHRISACAFLGVGYVPPQPVYVDPITQSRTIAQMVGYDVLAYRRFFIESDAATLIEKHIDSFINLVYPEKPSDWEDSACLDGGARAWIESDKKSALPSYMTQQDKDYHGKMLLSGGLSAPLCWYKVFLEEGNAEDDANIPLAAYDIAQPLLFVAFTADRISLPIFGDTTTRMYAKGSVTRKEVDGDHWVAESHSPQLNDILLEWIKGLH
ncbi:alpha/beta-hydrolase [Mycena crocata]|nr:alpha/beta-hydrolase [Mycena crocata]